MKPRVQIKIAKIKLKRDKIEVPFPKSGPAFESQPAEE